MGAIVVYSAAPNPGHSSNDIEVSVNGVPKYLQQAIDSNDFVKNNLVIKDIKMFTGTACPTNQGWTKISQISTGRYNFVYATDGSTDGYNGVLCIKYGNA